MNKITKLLASALVFASVSSIAFAGEKIEVESYAHPTLFDSSASVYVKPDAKNYVVGNGKVLKTTNRMGMKNKENVYTNSFARDILSIMKEQQFKDKEGFNPKMPVLRSELAVAISESIGAKANASKVKKYSDVANDYWAKSWIDNAYAAGLMIGYPDDSFKPDRPISKAEVFAVVAQMIEVPTDKSLIVPSYNNKQILYIPTWSIAASKEVVNSKLLEKLPNQDAIVNAEYLSKEQVAYLFGALKSDFTFNKKLAKDKNAPECVKNYTPVYLNIKLTDRVSARHSNIGDKFGAKTTKEVKVANQVFPVGSTVIGQVTEVQRPGIKNPGHLRVKFLEIKSGDCKASFPSDISEAQADKIKNPNFIARLFGMPFSGTARVVGVVGRTVGTGVNVIGNGLEQMGDDLSNTFVETLSLQPVAGAKSLGSTFVTAGLGLYDIAKLLVSGTFGVLYEVTDEVKYLIIPCASNDSSLNPGEELVVIF